MRRIRIKITTTHTNLAQTFASKSALSKTNKCQKYAVVGSETFNYFWQSPKHLPIISRTLATWQNDWCGQSLLAISLNSKPCLVCCHGYFHPYCSSSSKYLHNNVTRVLLSTYRELGKHSVSFFLFVFFLVCFVYTSIYIYSPNLHTKIFFHWDN